MTQFIMLPDETIINVAQVDKVELDRNNIISIGTVGKYGAVVCDDPDGKIYAWFADRATRVGVES